MDTDEAQQGQQEEPSDDGEFSPLAPETIAALDQAEIEALKKENEKLKKDLDLEQKKTRCLTAKWKFHDDGV